MDDLNTSKLLADINSALSNSKLNDVLNILYYLDKNLLKLDLFEQAESLLTATIDIPAEIDELAQLRWNAKISKNYQLADEIKQKILSNWFDIRDTKEGYEVIKKIEKYL